MPKLSTALILLAIALSAAGIAGCGSSSDSPVLSANEVTPDLTGADPRLVKIGEQSDEILPGGKPAFEARLKSLHGLPVVANKWASWCAPCKDEAPALQRASKKLANRVAFLGVNVNDSQNASDGFRKKYPMPYPSYDDPDWKIATLLPPSDKQPVTGIFDRRGKLVHLEIGAYETAAQLEADIRRFAGPIPASPKG